MRIRVVGAGLAGSEASYQLLKRGYEVELCEMRPMTTTPAHKTSDYAELVCSNSLKSISKENASGLLKDEMRLFDSLILRCAEANAVPAGSALAVDRKAFSAMVKDIINSFPNFSYTCTEYSCIDDTIPTIIATGPLTSTGLLESLIAITGQENLNFYDAAAPIIDAESIDYDHAFFGARYGVGDDDYLNVPLSSEEYATFFQALTTAERVVLHDFERNVFEGCMPVEVMASRGYDALRYGPMRPVGLTGPDGKRAYAVIQLRRETAEGTAYNMVGFQTNLTFPEQRRVFGLIPALRNAEYLRYGVMHKNTFVNAPQCLNADFSLKTMPNVYIAGQLSGVEGYMESTMSGLLSAIHCDRAIRGECIILPPPTTICGALSRYITIENADFQPMNANFGILSPLAKKDRDKTKRKLQYYERGVADMREYYEELSK